jgi:hypothetical protein
MDLSERKMEKSAETPQVVASSRSVRRAGAFAKTRGARSVAARLGRLDLRLPP